MDAGGTFYATSFPCSSASFIVENPRRCREVIETQAACHVCVEMNHALLIQHYLIETIGCRKLQSVTLPRPGRRLGNQGGIMSKPKVPDTCAKCEDARKGCNRSYLPGWICDRADMNIPCARGRLPKPQRWCPLKYGERKKGESDGKE